MMWNGEYTNVGLRMHVIPDGDNDVQFARDFYNLPIVGMCGTVAYQLPVNDEPVARCVDCEIRYKEMLSIKAVGVLNVGG